MHKLNPFPNKDDYVFKEGFIERYSKLTDWETFSTYCLSFLRRSLRVNTLKITIKEVKERLEAQGWTLEQVPWCKEAFYIYKEERRDSGNTMEHQLGYYYIQEAASLLPPLVLNPKPGEVVLDMAASPGSKTSQMASMMQNKGILIANDPDMKRMAPLAANMTRLGITNTLITTMRGQQFRKWKEQFDKVLIDAPCSGTGTIRKSPKTIRIWNPNMLKKIGNVQKELIEAAFLALKKGGVMVYSTCSLEPEENEAIVTWLLSRHEDAKLESFTIPSLKHEEAVKEFEGNAYHKDIQKTLRLWPQDNDTEGFYVAKIKKN
jgi:NOL1/NOP2/sun family putative RNA methylase